MVFIFFFKKQLNKDNSLENFEIKEIIPLYD